MNAARGEAGPSPATSPIELWWRASDAHALYDRVSADGVEILQEPFDGPLGRTFALADPDGRVTIYEKDQPLLAAAEALTRRRIGISPTTVPSGPPSLG